MKRVQNGDNTQISVDVKQNIVDNVKKPMSLRKKLLIGGGIFLAIAAVVGLVLGLYFHFRPSSTHIQTTVSQTNDGTVHLSTKFVYTDNNMIEDNVNQTFTIMFAGVNSSDTRKRMLQTAEGQNVNVDTTLHYTHESGIQIKFRDNQVLNISVPIDQVVQYITQQEGGECARLLGEELTQYEEEGLNITGSEIYDDYRNEILSTIQDTTNNYNLHMRNCDIYELQYDQKSGTYKYGSPSKALNRRRLNHFRRFFHRIGRFIKKVAKKVVNFIKKDGPKIVKQGAIAVLAGVDIAATGPSGISDAVKMFKSGKVSVAAELTAKGVATNLLPQLSLPIEFIGQSCFSDPPKMHCTKQGAINAAKSVVSDQVKKHALTTVVSLAK